MRAPEEIIVKIKADDEFFDWLEKVGLTTVSLGESLQEKPQSKKTFQAYKELVLLLATCPIYLKFEEQVKELLDSHAS